MFFVRGVLPRLFAPTAAFLGVEYEGRCSLVCVFFQSSLQRMARVLRLPIAEVFVVSTRSSAFPAPLCGRSSYTSHEPHGFPQGVFDGKLYPLYDYLLIRDIFHVPIVPVPWQHVFSWVDHDKCSSRWEFSPRHARRVLCARRWIRCATPGPPALPLLPKTSHTPRFAGKEQALGFHHF